MKTVFLLEKIQYQMEITRYWYIDIWLLERVLTLNADNQKVCLKGVELIDSKLTFVVCIELHLSVHKHYRFVYLCNISEIYCNYISIQIFWYWA